jgi:hypothetical protein
VTSTLAAIAFDPTIRGLLVVATGVIVLIGSIYLIVATNTGFRLGLLITLAGLLGWCFSMGIIWWIYGIGLRGADPSWIDQEINFNRDDPVLSEVLAKLPRTEDLPDPAKMYADYVEQHPDVAKKVEAAEGEGYVPETLTKLVTLVPELKPEIDDQLNGWRILSESDSRRGDAVAASDAFLIAKEAFGQQTAGSYTSEDVFFYGGKGAAEPATTPDEYNKLQQAVRRVQSALELKNPPLYAAVTLQKNVEQTVAPGEAPPPAVIDQDAAIVTTFMERNLGSRRLWPAVFTLLTGILFACFATLLHFRDKRAMQTRSDWKPSKAG